MTAVSQVETAKLPPQRSLLRTVLRWCRRQPLGAISAGILVIIILVAMFADIVAPYDPVANDFAVMLTAPNLEYLLGTDQFGRDVLSRIIYGAQTALFVGFTAAFFGSTIGLVLGVTSAYMGGLFDLLFQRVMDVFMAFPTIIIALAIVAALGSGTQNVILAIAIPMIPNCARVVRSSAMQVRELPYVDAARSLGFSHARIVLRHMVPNVTAPYLIMFTSFLGQAILTEASLSFLGLGVQEPTPAWGLMLQGGAEEYAESAIWMALFPGLAITLSVFAFNLFGDAIRDTLDPRLRSQ